MENQKVRFRDHFAPGVLPTLAVLLVGFLAMAAAIVYQGWQDKKQYDAARPPIPSVYHAFFPEDPVIGPILTKAAPGPDAEIARPKDVLMTPVGYGGDFKLSGELCKMSHEGHLTQIGAYDEQNDGNPESIVAVYSAPAHSFAGAGECASNLVFMVDQSWFISIY